MCPSVRGQESPTLHDLLSVTVFKRDFAGIRFLSRKVAVPTLLSTIHYLLLWMWRTKGYGGCSNTSVWVVKNSLTTIRVLEGTKNSRLVGFYSRNSTKSTVNPNTTIPQI